jgi:carboxylate-amine ligase
MATSLIRSSGRSQRVTERGPSAPACTGFVSGGAFSVGAEEELFLLDRSGDLAPAGSESFVDTVRRATAGEPGTVSSELFAAQIEFSTAVCTDAGAIVPQLTAFRTALLAAGGRPLAAGLHPTAPFGEAVLNPAPRYRLIGDALAGLLRTPTAAFQVHVGLPDEEAALLAYRGIRHRLAVVQALASNSPFWHGRDSGMASARWAVISSYPRGGVPPILRSWGEYTALLEATATAAQAPDYTQIWWDARLQPRLGTIEVRVMDAQYSTATAAGLTALVQGLVRHAVENPVAVDVPSAVLSENSFRVARYGLETTVTGVDGSHRPVRELAVEAVRDARAVLAADGLDQPLAEVEKIVADPPEYVRQRRLHARSGIEGVLADLVARTEAGS